MKSRVFMHHAGFDVLHFDYGSTIVVVELSKLSYILCRNCWDE